MEKAASPSPGGKRGQVIWGTRFGAARAGSPAASPPPTGRGSGWYHDAAIREAEAAFEVLPFPSKPA